MAYEIEGRIKVVGDKQTFGSGFVKREFVIMTEHDKYPQMIKFELHKERADLIDARYLGELARVKFGVRGSEYNGRHYVSLIAYGVVCAMCETKDPGQDSGDFGGQYGEPVDDAGGLF